ncbi:MAG: YiiD C-terminal domain-containing protein [Dokdonella sp.]|uniref:YiiD C-terminal domain-containing protein n=1 Tax=Dokdonella sp. TaxID=2291710 RepID=UPI0025B8CF15|nr:YiiD C-terminal domain-containing protein [Dokdonella sp.]MBZ0222343.1 thioesterase domain-containing protein [Dokdonella sp.]MCC7254725.1 YiiD C-terminal domain-containing protein [Dokdonella sp.]
MPTPAAALERELLARIPLARAMDLQVQNWDGASLTLAVPLAPNINDKGCAFGGSLTSLMTLASWGVVELALRERGLDCDVYVQDSTVRYRAPVWGDFSAQAQLAAGESFEDFFATLAARGKARLSLNAQVPLTDGSPAASLSSRFVAIVRAAD